MVNRTGMICHYTSIKVLDGILANYRHSEDKDHLVFWASSAYAMNDSTEMQYGWKILRNNFQAYEVEYCVPEDKRLSLFMDKIANSDIATVFYKHFYREDMTPFVLSFTEKIDELPMWSIYGGDGMGVCLCFDENQLNIHNELLRTLMMLNVLYINQEDNDQLSSMVLGQIVPTQYTEYLNESKWNDMDKITAIGSVLPLISAYIKDSSFKFEREIRIPFLVKDIHKSVDFRTSLKGNIIPYIKIPVPIKALKKIIIGPCVHSHYLENGLKFVLSTCGIDIPISYSNVPYRPY